MKTISFTRNNDFLRLYRKGKVRSDPCLITYILPNKLGFVRLGLTTSKKIGNAVARSRARRVMRVAIRELIPRLNGSYDIVLVARTRTTLIKSNALTSILTAQLEKLGALKSIEKE